MHIRFQTSYLSVAEFVPIDLPRLSVITGVNGSGKSHFLQAIAGRSIIADDIEHDEIVLFSGETFRLDNQSVLSASQAIQERYNAWIFLTQQTNPNVGAALTSYRNNIGQAADEILEIADKVNKPLWKLGSIDGIDEQKFEFLSQYKRNVQSFLLGSQLKGNHQTESILALCKKLHTFIDLLEKEQFETLYEPRQSREGFLPNQLTLAFADYYSKLEENQYKKFRNEHYGENHELLTTDEFTRQYGPKPWDVINQVLSQLGTMPYRVNSPEGLTRFDNFQAELTHQYTPNIRPNFSDLSSGEKVLIALVASVYKARSDKNFPRLLLLDEIDASLHPSMINSMLEIIQDAFISNDVYVILVTHSPTTVAICPEDSIFVMHPRGSIRLEHRTRAEALDILTEGFVTLNKGLTVLDEIARTKVSIVTEGRNIDLVQRALNYSRVEGVKVISGVEDRSGSSQLKTLFDFFTALPHDNAIIVLWDCDAEKYRSLISKNNTFPFVFSCNDSNTIAPRGIENLFAADHVQRFKKEIHFADGTIKIEFDENQKGPFARYVLDRNEPSDFVQFQPFVEFVQNLCSESIKPNFGA